MAEAYENTTIILDTNILNYICSQQINDGAKILALLKQYKMKLWIPHTVYEEFNQIDFDNLNDQMKDITEKEYIEKFSNLVNEVRQLLDELLSNGQMGTAFTVEEMIQIAQEGIITDTE